MPGKNGFTSKAQRGYMFVHHPKLAKRMQAETSKRKKLPKYAKRR